MLQMKKITSPPNEWHNISFGWRKRLFIILSFFSSKLTSPIDGNKSKFLVHENISFKKCWDKRNHRYDNLLLIHFKPMNATCMMKYFDFYNLCSEYVLLN